MHTYLDGAEIPLATGYHKDLFEIIEVGIFPEMTQ